jgi:predicted nucleic acid-binding Zn ribbon protein
MAAAGLEATEQRRRVRRSALLWALIAAAFYVGFIVLAVVRGTK